MDGVIPDDGSDGSAIKCSVLLIADWLAEWQWSLSFQELRIEMTRSIGQQHRERWLLSRKNDSLNCLPEHFCRKVTIKSAQTYNYSNRFLEFYLQWGPKMSQNKALMRGWTTHSWTFFRNDKTKTSPKSINFYNCLASSSQPWWWVELSSRHCGLLIKLSEIKAFLSLFRIQDFELGHYLLSVLQLQTTPTSPFYMKIWLVW